MFSYLYNALPADVRLMIDRIVRKPEPNAEEPTMPYVWPIPKKHRRRYHAKSGEFLDKSLERAVVIAHEHGEVEFRSSLGVEFRVMPWYTFDEAHAEFWRQFYAQRECEGV